MSYFTCQEIFQIRRFDEKLDQNSWSFLQCRSPAATGRTCGFYVHGFISAQQQVRVAPGRWFLQQEPPGGAGRSLPTPTAGRPTPSGSYSTSHRLKLPSKRSTQRTDGESREFLIVRHSDWTINPLGPKKKGQTRLEPFPGEARKTTYSFGRKFRARRPRARGKPKSSSSRSSSSSSVCVRLLSSKMECEQL